MLKKLLAAAAIAALAVLPAGAANFFDTSAPDQLFQIGVRLGVNSSNRSLNKDVFNLWNHNAWGAGLELGAVANINFRDYISIQPGLFFETRSRRYTYINVQQISADGQSSLTQYGNDRSCNFTIPILCSVHFNLSDDVRWNVEAGPYLQLVLDNSIKNNVAGVLISGDEPFSYPIYSAPNATPAGYAPVKASTFDFGFKFGTSLRVLDHYLVGVHYEAGCLHPWKNADLGGANKAWVFSLGYDF